MLDALKGLTTIEGVRDISGIGYVLAATLAQDLDQRTSAREKMDEKDEKTKNSPRASKSKSRSHGSA